MSSALYPLVSVRLMVYNNEPFIREAVESILMQKTEFKVEIVVGDDFSTDNTLNIIKEYADTANIYFNILKRKVGGQYWKDRKRLGRLHNFKNIIDNCSGKYIALLDGDDYWTDPLKLQKQVDFLENNLDFNGCFHNTMCLDYLSKESHLYVWRNYEKDVFYQEDTITKFSLFHTSSYFFRSKDMDVPKWFYLIFSGDMAMLSIISKKGKLKLINEKMSVYRKHENNITSKLVEFVIHKNRIKLIKYLNIFFEHKFDLKAKEVISFHENEMKKYKNEMKRYKINLIKSELSSIVEKIKAIFKKRDE